MKKLAIGCGVASLVLVILLGVALYWGYTKAKDLVGPFTQMGEAANLDQQVTNRASFTPPASGELTSDQLARFTRLNEQVQADLGPKFDGLKTRYDQMEARMKQEQREANPAEAITAIRDLAGLIMDVRRAQVTALNAQNMSVEEYRWVRDQAYAAAGIPIAAFNVNGFIEAAKGGDVERLKQAMEHQVGEAVSPNAANKALVAPLAANLQKWVAVAWLGF